MQAQEVSDDSLAHIGCRQFSAQIAHLEEKYDKVGEAERYEDRYHFGLFLPNMVTRTGSNLEDCGEKKKGKN